MITKTEIEKANFRNVWVIGEVEDGNILPVTHELLGAARNLADKRGSEVWAVLMGNSIQNPHLFAFGADVCLLVDDQRLTHFIDELESKILSRLIEKYLPEIILCGATSRGRALIPRVAVSSYCGLTADCTQLDIDPDNGDLLQTRPAFGGNILATIRSSNHRPQIASVRPRVMKIPQPDNDRDGITIFEKILPTDEINNKKVVDVYHDSQSAINLADAEIIIAGGRGTHGKAGFELLRQLAQKVGGAVGASRAAVDSGWIPYTHQVGQTGQTVQTKIYIACGISGQIQHLVGMQSCDLIIAIDKNPDTPMMQMADIAITGDMFEILPELINEINQR
ncbi:MAG: electron transfer flavoprotein subunit alpha [Firmicutes bacterium HGW-Firmicutes-19]|jgi:electron transfer flavoprotein alpha subunit|nr:MAG: electron transfer flavoprotein subunit alpha [Firmicutes bacterium HGW-Firmicutes-19]